MTQHASPPIALSFSARTDVGRMRASNEDNFLVDRKLRLHIVCDGLGGHRGGEVASATAVNVVRDELLRKRDVLDRFERGDPTVTEDAVLNLLRAAVIESNHRVHERGRMTPSQRGMGTTLSLLLIAKHRAFIAHVGDTRVYRLRGRDLTQLTEDHSLVNELQRGLDLPAADLAALDAQARNQVTRAVGVFPTVDVDVAASDVAHGDRYLLCSDGLHGLIDDLTLAHVLDDDDISTTAERLVDAANDRGGRDNITAIVLHIDAPPDLTPVRRPSVRACPLFRDLGDHDLDLLAPHLTELSLTPGEPLVAEHATTSPNHGLVIVISGELEVFRLGESIALLRPNDYYGEDTLFSDRARDASIVATTTTSLLHLDRSNFEQITLRRPDLGLRLLTVLARSLGRRLDTMARELGPRFLFEPPGAMTRPVPRPLTNPRALVDTEPDAKPVAPDLPDEPQLPRRPRSGDRRMGAVTTRPSNPNSGRHTRPMPRPADIHPVDLAEPPPLPIPDQD